MPILILIIFLLLQSCALSGVLIGHVVLSLVFHTQADTFFITLSQQNSGIPFSHSSESQVNTLPHCAGHIVFSPTELNAEG